MANVSIANKGTDVSSVDDSFYVMTVTAADANKWYLIAVTTYVASGSPPTLSQPSGLGITWDAAEIGNQLYDGGLKRVTFWKGKGASPNGTSLTISLSGTSTGCIVAAGSLTNADDTTPVVAANIKGGNGTGTSLTSSLNQALATAESLVVVAVALDVNSSATAGGGGTRLNDAGHTSPPSRLSIHYELNDTSMAPTFTNADYGWLAIECQATVSSQSVVPVVLRQYRARVAA